MINAFYIIYALIKFVYEVGEEANDVLMFVYCRNTSRVQRERVVNLILIPILIVLRVSVSV